MIGRPFDKHFLGRRVSLEGMSGGTGGRLSINDDGQDETVSDFGMTHEL